MEMGLYPQPVSIREVIVLAQISVTSWAKVGHIIFPFILVRCISIKINIIFAEQWPFPFIKNIVIIIIYFRGQPIMSTIRLNTNWL